MFELLIAFGAGLLSFLSPCVLPLIPGYISYVSGNSLNNIIAQKRVNLFPIVMFTFGFSIIFIIFGAAATLIGKFFLQNSNELRIVAGIIIIIFSLQIMGILNIKFLNYEKRFLNYNSKGFFGPLLLGMAFGFGWTPCIGPILGSILALASTEKNLNEGIILLIFYSFGLALPFILSGYLILKFINISKKISSKLNIINIVGGTILLLTGILIVTNQLQVIGFYLLEYIPIFGKFG